jgi:predicted lipase
MCGLFRTFVELYPLFTLSTAVNAVVFESRYVDGDMLTGVALAVIWPVSVPLGVVRAISSFFTFEFLAAIRYSEMSTAAKKEARLEEYIQEHTTDGPEVSESMQRLIEDLKQYEESHSELVAILTFRAMEGRYSDFHRNAFDMPKLTLMDNAKKLPKIVEGVLQGRYDD